MSQELESYVVEMAEWLSKAADTWNPANLIKNFSNGVQSSCQACGLDFTRLAAENILSVQFFLPIADMDRYFPADKLGEAVEMVNTAPGGEIGAKIGRHKKLGECVIVERHYRIPTAFRDGFVINEMLPPSDAALFSAILEVARNPDNGPNTN